LDQSISTVEPKSKIDLKFIYRYLDPKIKSNKKSKSCRYLSIKQPMTLLRLDAILIEATVACTALWLPLLPGDQAMSSSSSISLFTVIALQSG
jgi:hypothetical protein